MTETPIFQGHLQTDNTQLIGSAACQVVHDSSFTALIAKPENVESPCTNVEPLPEVMRRLELASAHIHNVRLAARNARNPNGKLELLEKTVPGDGADLANPLKGSDMIVSVPMKPVKIRDRPKNFNPTGRRLEDFTGQDILDLIVFYNNDFGIAPEDDEAARRKKLLVFLTGDEELKE